MCESCDVNMSENLISQSELARRLNRPYPQIAKAVQSGRILPHATICRGRLRLFDLDRLDEIEAALELETVAQRIANPVEFEC